MSKNLLTSIDGWTPVIDDLVKEVGVMAALIYGRVWRYCQMDDKACWAAQGTIAEEYGISPDTVGRSLEKLVNAGYLIASNGSGNIKTKVYTLTDKINLLFSVTVAKNTNRKMSDDHPQNAEASSRKMPELPTANCGTKIVLKKELKKEEETELTRNPIIDTLEKYTGILASTPDDFKAIDQLIAMKATDDDVSKAVDWIHSMGKQVYHYSSLVNPVKVQIAKRVQCKPKEDIKKKYKPVHEYIE